MLATNSDEISKGEKHMAPHVLAMSATPIPRTLALALYGDMSLTQVCILVVVPSCSFMLEERSPSFFFFSFSSHWSRELKQCFNFLKLHYLPKKMYLDA